MFDNITKPVKFVRKKQFVVQRFILVQTLVKVNQLPNDYLWNTFIISDCFPGDFENIAL